jgi:hypothetical protein
MASFCQRTENARSLKNSHQKNFEENGQISNI